MTDQQSSQVIGAAAQQRLATVIERIVKPYLVALDRQSSVEGEVSESDFVEIHEALTGYIQTCLLDATELYSIATKSHFHDNGFLKIVLLRDVPPHTEVRLHIWGLCQPHMNESTTVAPNIHSHSADFVSLVLQGQIVEKTYSEEKPSHEGTTAHVYEKWVCSSRGDAAEYTMTAIGKVTLRQLSEKSLRGFQVHGLRHDVLHRVESSAPESITLFLQGGRKSVGTLSYSESDKDWEHVISSPHLSKEVLEEALLQLQEHLLATTSKP